MSDKQTREEKLLDKYERLVDSYERQIDQMTPQLEQLSSISRAFEAVVNALIEKYGKEAEDLTYEILKDQGIEVTRDGD